MKKEQTTFESFLQQYWMDEEAEGQTKDQCEDACEDWMSRLDVAELIELGEAFGRQVYLEGFDRAGDVIFSKTKEILLKYTDPKPQYHGMFADEIAKKTLEAYEAINK